ncbi:MAG: O-antigen ligase family protein [Janthinobacterium lividum]
MEITFALWCLISCFWSQNIISSITIFSANAGLIFLYSITTSGLSTVRIKYIDIGFVIGISIAIILFFVESSMGGIFHNNFKYYFQNNSLNKYSLYSLDRGCALLTISSWPLLEIFITKRKYYISCLLYLLILYILCLSDSLASLVGFVISGGVFLFIRVFSIKFSKYIRIFLILIFASFPLIAYNMNPSTISDRYSKLLPDSAKHRLFIWNFVSKKIISKPILGYGFGSSKKYVAPQEEMINYNGYYWSPLPLHPHNNVLQILFETGLIGFSLFLLSISKYLKKLEQMIIVNPTIGGIFYACFINYFVIGMISFSILQVWWVASAIWVMLMLKYNVRNTQDQNLRTY